MLTRKLGGVLEIYEKFVGLDPRDHPLGIDQVRDDVLGERTGRPPGALRQALIQPQAAPGRGGHQPGRQVDAIAIAGELAPPVRPGQPGIHRAKGQPGFV